MSPAGRFAIIVLGVVAWASSARTAQPARPVPEQTSVVLITLDTTRADHVGCYGAVGVETPNLDALARGGTRFSAASSPVPLTFPAHASIMTGRVPRRHGVRDNALFRLDSGIPVLAEALGRAGYLRWAFVSAAVLDHGLGLARGFDVYEDQVRIGDRAAFNYEERAASQTNGVLKARLADLKAPFFLWIHYFDPHLPYVPPEPYRTRFKDRLYDGEIAFMDRAVGEVLEAARSKGAPVLIVAAGDHGEGLGDHGERAHGVLLYQATQHVPLILSGPGVPAGRVVSTNVGLIDVAPTILDLLGLPPLPEADGRSLRPLLRGRAMPEAAYEMESYFGRFAYGWAPIRALMRGPMKYIEAPRPEFYDLAADPSEARNVLESRTSDAQPLARALHDVTSGDSPRQNPVDPDLAEQRDRLAALGYVGGAAPRENGVPIDPKDGILWLADLDAARRALQLGDPKDGIAPLERLLSRNPRNILALLTLSQCHLGIGQVDRAIEIDRRAVEMNPENDMTWFNLGNALAAKAKTDPAALPEARRAYDKALSLDARSVEVYLAYAALLATRVSPEEARQLLARARGFGVKDPDVEAEIGLLELGRGATDDAKRAFERALELNSRLVEALVSLGKIAYTKGEYRQSAQYYARALESAPSASVARTLGSIRLYKLDDAAGARQAFLKALELTPPGDPTAADLREILASLDQAP
jgi:arylsulfatase A-like enzyme/Flp pilus assembly protein TadD